MLKRILALAVCLALCLSLPALAEEVSADLPVRDNRPLFMSRLTGALESCDPASQALSLFMTVPPDSVTLRLLPTESGVRLEADAGGAPAAALEAGPEALWILYREQVLEVPFSLFTALAQGYAAPPIRDMDALLAKYRGPVSAWALKALELLSPMVSVSDSSSSTVQIHISGDARQLTDALIALVDEILADTQTVSSLLEDLKPFLAAAGAEDIPDAAALLEGWKYARRQLLADGPDAFLTMDVALQPSGTLFITSGTLTVKDKQLVFDARLRPGSVYGAYVFSASVSGSLLENCSRMELELNKALSSYPGSAVVRAQTWTVDGTLAVTDTGGDVSKIILNMTETENVGSREFLRSYDGTLKLNDIRGRTVETIDFGLTAGRQSASLRLSLQDRWGDITTALRLFFDEASLDLRVDAADNTLTLRLDLDENKRLSYGRFCTAEHDFGRYTELIYDGVKLLYRDSTQEFLCRAEYPSPDHLALLITRTEWSSSEEPTTARVDVTLPGEEDPCVLRGVVTDVYGREALRAELTAEPSAPVPSLGSREDRMILDMDTLLLLLSRAASGAGVEFPPEGE